MGAGRRITAAGACALIVLGFAGGGVMGLPTTLRSVAADGSSPQVSQDINHDTSPALRSIPGSGTPGKTHPARHHQGSARPATNSPDTSQQSATPHIPSTSTNFTGIGANGSAPPDDDGAIGPTQYVELVNTELAVYSKTGSLIYGPNATNTVWSGFGGGCQTNNDGDGTVVFDPLAQRWVIQQFSVSTTPYLECIAVSTSTDATGSWNRYSFATGPDFPDYPKLGAWSDGYYVSYNLFNSAGTAGLGTLLCAYDRSQMVAGNGATQQCFTATTAPEKTFLPASIDGSTPPPAGEPEWFVGLSPSGASALASYTFHVDFTTPANSTLSAQPDLGVNSFSEACGGGTCIPQSGTRQQLDSLGDRLMYRLAYRNVGSHESMVVSHSVTAGSSVGERWYELRPSSGALTLFQQGTYAPDSNFRWMGSIAMDQSGDMGLGYSVSSSSLHPGLRYTGRLATDPLGSMPQGEATIFTGAGSQSGQNLSRWGDYSEMTVDPVDGCTFWYVNEYLPSNGAFNWATRIGSFKFPSCGGTPTNDFSISANPSSVGVTQGGSVPTTINTAVTSGTAQNVALSASGLPTGASAGFNPSSVTAGSGSTMTISTTSSTAPGSYPITVTGTGSSATHTTTVTLTVNSNVPNDFSISASPSTVTVTQGNSGPTTVSTQVTSGVAQSVALSASGLPSGATASFNPTSVSAGNSSTLTISTAPTTPTGSVTVTITGTGTSATHTTSITLTVNQASSGSGISNGGFETGNFSGWTTAGQSESVVAGGHTGSYAARLGSTSPTNGDSTMQQTITVPAAGASLSFWYQPHCPDIITYDQEQMQIRSTANTVLATLLNVCSNSGSWTQVTAGLNSYAGQTIVLWFNNHDDNYAADPTYTLFDDVSLGAAPPPPPPNVVQNPGFETGTLSSWTASGQSESVVTGGHSGTYAARLGSTSPTNGNSAIQQTVTVPAAGATLSFWYQPHCPDTLTYDQEQMQVRNASNAVLITVLNVCSNSGAWTQVSTSLNTYAGQTVVLWFNSHDDNYPSDPTYTLFDDVSVQ